MSTAATHTPLQRTCQITPRWQRHWASRMPSMEKEHKNKKYICLTRNKAGTCKHQFSGWFPMCCLVTCPSSADPRGALNRMTPRRGRHVLRPSCGARSSRISGPQNLIYYMMWICILYTNIYCVYIYIYIIYSYIYMHVYIYIYEMP